MFLGLHPGHPNPGLSHVFTWPLLVCLSYPSPLLQERTSLDLGLAQIIQEDRILRSLI